MREYKSSELALIAEMLNGMEVQEVSVHSFGEFLLSSSGFVTSVMPALHGLRHLKLNIEHTFCKEKYLQYPSNLESLTLTSFKFAHIKSFLGPLTIDQESKYLRLRHLRFEDLVM